MKHVFDTVRLRVFIDQVKPTDHNDERDIFIAFRTDEDRPMVCATALVLDCRKTMGERVVDWLEVSSEYRRSQFATELLNGIEAHYGEAMFICGGSDDGHAFCAQYQHAPAGSIAATTIPPAARSAQNTATKKGR